MRFLLRVDTIPSIPFGYLAPLTHPTLLHFVFLTFTLIIRHMKETLIRIQDFSPRGLLLSLILCSVIPNLWLPYAPPFIFSSQGACGFFLCFPFITITCDFFPGSWLVSFLFGIIVLCCCVLRINVLYILSVSSGFFFSFLFFFFRQKCKSYLFYSLARNKCLSLAGFFCLLYGRRGRH